MAARGESVSITPLFSATLGGVRLATGSFTEEEDVRDVLDGDAKRFSDSVRLWSAADSRVLCSLLGAAATLGEGLASDVVLVISSLGFSSSIFVGWSANDTVLCFLVLDFGVIMEGMCSDPLLLASVVELEGGVATTDEGVGSFTRAPNQ